MPGRAAWPLSWWSESPGRKYRSMNRLVHRCREFADHCNWSDFERGSKAIPGNGIGSSNQSTNSCQKLRIHRPNLDVFIASSP
jgi:hypothetical protein